MSSKKKSNISWLSGLLSILLIGAVIAVFWVLKDRVLTLPESKNNKHTSTSPAKIDSKNNTANQLVRKFVSIKIATKEKNNLLQAVNNSLQHLQETNHHQVLVLLQKLELKAAISYLIESLEEEEKLREIAKIWVDIGNLQQLHSSQLALYAYKKATQFDDKNSNAWNRLGHFYRQQQQFTLAENAYNKVLVSSFDTTTTQAVALTNFGLLYQTQGKLEQAEASYLKALVINETKNNTASLASNNENLAIIYKKNNNFDLSEKHYLVALQHYGLLKQDNSIATIQASLASLYHQYHKLEKAKQFYQIALGIYQKTNNQKKTASSYSNLGILYQQQGKSEIAKDFFQKSLAINKNNQQQQGVADQYGYLGVLQRLQKKFIKSEALHLQSLAIYQELKHSEGISQQQTNLGFLYQAWGKTEKACQAWENSKEILIQINNKNRIVRIASLIEKHCQIKKVGSEDKAKIVAPN
jgi:tetratricopeptide (TPR) repeat protein